MYTKNPVTGKNETLVNTSMLKGAVEGVTTKITSKADKGALDALSVYTEGVKTSIGKKADKSAVEAVSAYAEGMLPKTVYSPLVDAYVGLACKVADSDVLEGAAKMAYAANPEKYVTSNPDRADVAEVTVSNYKTGNPIYDAVHTAGSVVELPPFLRLKSFSGRVGRSVTSWKTELPNLTHGQSMFWSTGLTSWTVELPNLTDGSNMFDNASLTAWTTELPNLVKGYQMFNCTGLTAWTVELPNLIDGQSMFASTGLTSWTVELPNLTTGSHMFYSCERLTSWTTELPNLTDASTMFQGAGLESFTAELPKLRNGDLMFSAVSTEYVEGTVGRLTTFRGTLPSLVNGEAMFQNQPLDLESVRCIAESINDVRFLSEDAEVTKRLDICVGYDIETTPLHEVYLNTIRDKGWTVAVNGVQF